MADPLVNNAFVNSYHPLGMYYKDTHLKIPRLQINERIWVILLRKVSLFAEIHVEMVVEKGR